MLPFLRGLRDNCRVRPGQSKATGWLSISATYVGAIVGAGFASGREIMLFFTSIGLRSLDATILAGVLFFVIGAFMLDLVRLQRPRDLTGLLEANMGSLNGRVAAALLTVVIFGALAIMLAGGGALEGEGENSACGLTHDQGILLTAALVCAIVYYGPGGILRSNLVLVPVMVLAILYITMTAVLVPQSGVAGDGIPGGATFWPFRSVLYVIYNIVLVLGILVSIGDRIPSRGTAYMGALVGGIMLGFLLAATDFAMSLHGLDRLNPALPMMILASRAGNAAYWGYRISLYLAMVTSATSAAYSLGAQLSPLLGVAVQTSSILVTLAAIPLARLGFVDLVASIYPATGILGMPIIAILVAKYISSCFARPPVSHSKGK